MAKNNRTKFITRDILKSSVIGSEIGSALYG